jgi:twitching motility protein PilT
MRQSGALLPLEREHLSHAEMEAIGTAIVPPERVDRFEASGEIDFAYSLPGVGRFRVNVFRQRGSVSAAARTLRFGGPSFDEMGLPEVIRQLADEQRGLVLVTGPTARARPGPWRR